MKTVVFVDDEPKLLNAMRRTLRGYRDIWRMIFVQRGQQALDILASQPVHVIMSDIRMPEMNGIELLKKVRERSPETLRVVLTGHADKKEIIEAVDIIHQYLQKPCDPHKVVETIQSSLALQDNLTNPKIKSLVARMDSLPSLPTHYQELMKTLRSPESNIEQIAGIVIKDISLMMRILHTVNSAYMGLPRNVSDPVMAVNLLGLDMVQALASTMQVFSSFEKCQCKHVNFADMWSHSLNVGLIAKKIAEMERVSQQMIDDAFLAGLLHDVGKLILATQLKEEYEKALVENTGSMAECEQAAFGSTHAEIGAYLLGLWGVRTPILEAVAYHHAPTRQLSEGFTIISAVHVANILEHGGENVDELVDMDYIEHIGLQNRYPAWKKSVTNLSTGIG